jgi:hypothetical protein
MNKYHEELVTEAYTLYYKTSVMTPYNPKLNLKAFLRYSRRFYKYILKLPLDNDKMFHVKQLVDISQPAQNVV